MIQHHTDTDEARQYLQNLMITGVIQNLVESVIEFNKDQTEALDKLLTAEEIELDTIPEPAMMTQQQQQQSSTPPPQQRGLFKRIFSCLCCGGCR
jgi:hypothetical protein